MLVHITEAKKKVTSHNFCASSIRIITCLLSKNERSAFAGYENTDAKGQTPRFLKQLHGLTGLCETFPVRPEVAFLEGNRFYCRWGGVLSGYEKASFKL